MRIATLSLSLVSAVSFAAEPNPFPITPDESGEKFIVSAPNPYVSSTGCSILKQGGNAIEVKDGKIYGATDRRRASSSIGE
ncbi:hypothetical protein [Vibrio crassostreae]|uniref:hypothetical protein n=1 Tax=Vibrio crassostreae TaxID=246167 RepID=UPI002A6EAD9F|nr:exported hypothetical protein [Vibrio crassostreae]CAK2383692.1 exported hypothetical protein [Vibrio crassostreae]CAK2551699.1 exported hypothetical protein [Vibrio crassostreae]